MVFSEELASVYTVASSLEDQISFGKEKKEYCKKGEMLFVTRDRGNVLIVFGKNGYFSVKKSSVKQVMINSPEELIEKIKLVDLKMSYGFPVEFVHGIVENKPWKDEFFEKLEKSDVRQSLRHEILLQR